MVGVVFFFKQKTAYEMRISDWSSDVCSSDLLAQRLQAFLLLHAEVLLLVDDQQAEIPERNRLAEDGVGADDNLHPALGEVRLRLGRLLGADQARELGDAHRQAGEALLEGAVRSEEHTSELQSLMRISYAVFCLKKNNNQNTKNNT